MSDSRTSRSLQVRSGSSEAGSGVVAGTNRALTVGGGSSFVLPAGGSVLSDPINLTAASTVRQPAISLYFQPPTGPTTWHPLAVTTNYIAPGNQVANPGRHGRRNDTTSWYFLSGIRVDPPTAADAVVAVGASTTDDHGSTVGCVVAAKGDPITYLPGGGRHPGNLTSLSDLEALGIGILVRIPTVLRSEPEPVRPDGRRGAPLHESRII